MELKAVDAYRSDWLRWVDFTISRAEAFAVDATSHTRSLEFGVETPAEAEAMFDALTYLKGASIVRMLEQFVGEDNFRDGLRRYMAHHKFSNTETKDLWNAISSETSHPVADIMHDWVYAPGFPMIEATSSDGQVTLRQSRASYIGSPEPADHSWKIPLVVSTPSGTESRVIETEETIDAAPGELIVINKDSHAFVKVAYDEELRGSLLDNLEELSPAERYGLIDDSWSAVLQGRMTTVSFLPLLEAFAFEADRTVYLLSLIHI